MPRPGSTREQGALAVAVVWLPAVAATVAWVATGRLHPVGSLGVVARQVAHAVDRPHGMPPGAPLLKRDVRAMRLRPERALRVGDVALLPVLHHLLDRPVPGPTTLDRRRTFPEVARPFGLQDLDRTDRHALAPSLLAHQLTLPCSQLRMGLLVCLVLLLGLAGGAFAVGGTVGRLPGDLVRLLRLPGLLTRAGEVAPSQEPPGATLQAGDQVAGPLQDGRDRSDEPAWRCARRWRSGINAGRPGRGLVGGCGSTPTWPPAEVAGARWQDSDAPAGGGLVRTTQVVPSPPALPSRRRSARHARASTPPRAPPERGRSTRVPTVPTACPGLGASLCGKAKLFGKAHASRNAGGSNQRATPTPLEASWPHCSWCSRWPTPCYSATPSSPTPAPAQSPSSTSRSPASPRASCWWSPPGSACWVRCCWGSPGAPRAPGAPSVASCGPHTATCRAGSPSSNATTPPSARSGSASADWRSCARRPARHSRPGSGPANRRSTRTRRASWPPPGLPGSRPSPMTRRPSSLRLARRTQTPPASPAARKSGGAIGWAVATPERLPTAVAATQAGGRTWRSRLPARRAALPSCGVPSDTAWRRCQLPSRTRWSTTWSWPSARPPPTPSCTGPATRSRSRPPSGSVAAGSRRPSATGAGAAPPPHARLP